MSADIEPVTPEQARAILEAAISARLGPDWRDEDSGWVLVSGHDYMARLARGRQTLDFFVDLLGEMTVKESHEMTSGESLQIVVIILVLLSIVIALLIVRAVSG